MVQEAAASRSQGLVQNDNMPSRNASEIDQAPTNGAVNPEITNLQAYKPPAHFKKFPNKSFRHINDSVYSDLKLYYPIDKIVDTPEFQRLRRLKQTAFVHLVYPGSEHSRFGHSLGVSHLALQVVEKLAANQPELKISSRDVLCVALSGLCHDLGHGPFCHIYDHIATEGFKHEEMSTRVFRHIMKKPHVRKALHNYLHLDEDVDFICEMINPPKQFIVDGLWALKGRPIEKSFLYGIVSNIHDSFDVDKYDYLQRDAQGSAPVSLNPITIVRIMDNTRVLFDRSLGFCRLGYAEKVKEDLKSIAQTRMEIHRNHYQHQKVLACDYMIAKAMKMISSYFNFYGQDGTKYGLSDCHLDVEAFIRSDDSVYSAVGILQPYDENVKAAEAILDQLENRKIPSLVAEIHVSREATKAEFVEFLKDKADDDLRDFFVMVKVQHCGLGMDKHPLSQVLLFNHKAKNAPTRGFRVDEYWMESFLGFPGLKTFMVFANVGASEDLKNSISQAVKTFPKKFSPSTQNTPIKRRLPSDESDDDDDQESKKSCFADENASPSPSF